MAEKDILERHFLEFADVMADVLKLAGFALPGLVPEVLKNLPVHTYLVRQDGIKARERDGYWLWTPAWNRQGELLFGAENQTVESPAIIPRALEYKVSNLLRWTEDGNPPVPEVNVILYYGMKPWKGPKTLREFYGIERYEKYGGIFGDDIVVIDLGALNSRQTQSLTSDLREVSEAVKAIQEGREYTGGRRKLKHFVAVTRLIASITGKTLSAFQLKELKEMKDEEQTMEMALEFLMKDKFAQTWNGGLKKGESIGLKKGESIGLKKGESIGLKKGETIGVDNSLRVFNYLESHGRLAEYRDVLGSRERMQAVLEEIDGKKQR